MKELRVVAGIIENNGELLCVQRGVSKYDYISHKFEFPGGKIEEGETNEQALARELREELEYDVTIGEHLITVTHTYADFSIIMYCYKCYASDRNFVLTEHEDYKWLKKDELNGLDWVAADLDIVDAIIKG